LLFSGEVPVEFEREVGVTAEEFARGMRVAHPAGVEQMPDGAYRLGGAGVLLEVRVEPLPSRRLGLFDLPAVRAHYRFIEGDPVQRKAFLARLDLGMQRGGG
jgi:hypothetical protein